MNKFRLTINALAIAIFMLAFASMAQAQATRTWVSGVGDDANPCSRTAPCKTFAGAISKTANGGEISVLDPGGFGAVTITKSITINGEGTLAGILNTATNGVLVNATSTDNIVLRDLKINGGFNAGVFPGGVDGVKVLAAKSVNIEDCVISNQQIGVEVAAGANVNLAIFRSIIENNSAAGVRVNTTAGAARASISNSEITNSAFAVHAKANSSVSVFETTIANNTLGVFAEGQSGPALVVVKNCSINNNSSNGVQAGGGGSTTTSTVRLSSNWIVGNNGAGISIQAQGFVDTFLNNELKGNNPDGCAACVNITASFQ
ncbi:MAG TPA: right-handed parallel beta-helix repeat-containing protein [Pyrinomonadaceae bacterium]|nr:right-handed parallel beta-helix repeat-containing protein [Pyrinomonadaceae bacterium]